MIATSTTQVAVAGMARSGWIALDEIAIFRRGSSPLPARLAFVESSVRHLFLRLAARVGRGARPLGDDDALDRDDDLDGLLERRVDVDGLLRVHQRMSVGGWRHVVDRRWFEWRFSNPLATYRFVYGDGDGDERDAYLVLATGRGLSSDTVRIVDWGAVDDAALGRLLDRLAGSLGSVTLELGLGGPPEPFARAGFFLASRAPIHARPVRLLWYPLGGGRSEGSRPSSVAAWRDIYSDNY